jgi:hypothetical protein
VLYHVENCISLCQYGEGFLLVVERSQLTLVAWQGASVLEKRAKDLEQRRIQAFLRRRKRHSLEEGRSG